MSALGAPDGDGPGGTFLLDPETFELRGQWEIDRGPQQLAYDFWWHLGHDTMVTSAWGTPNMVKDGVNPEMLLSGKYGTSCTSGTCGAVATSRNSTSARSSRWFSSCDRRTTHPRLRFRRRGASGCGICRRRSGYGTVSRRRQRVGRQVGGPEGDRDPGGAGRSGSFRPSYKGSRRSRRSSPTSTCRWTTGTCTSRAGARASSSSTTSPTRSTRRRSARSASAASSAGPRIRAHRSSR